MMKKSMLWRGMILLAVSACAMAGIGTTSQHWDFEQQTSRFGILPSQYLNPYGEPVVALIADMSGTGVSWENGAWQGEEFKIILDIPNQPESNPYKNLWIDLKYQGDISFLWVADVDTGNHFTLMDEQSGQDGDWLTLSQKWRFEPNPREEIVVIGMKGVGSTLAVIDEIIIQTECVPEPMTISLLAVGAGIIARRKCKKNLTLTKFRRVV